MLTFEQKISILDSYAVLQRKNVSLGRVNYHFEESQHDKKTVAFHLHPNGNGYVFAGLLRGYETDDKGFVNIRTFTEAELRSLLDASITSLSIRIPETPVIGKRKRAKAAAEGDSRWKNTDGNQLVLKFEDDLWYVYAGLHLEMAFETLEEAQEYLAEEGFVPDKA